MKTALPVCLIQPRSHGDGAPVEGQPNVDLLTCAATFKPVHNATVHVEVSFTPSLVVQRSVSTRGFRPCTVKIFSQYIWLDSSEKYKGIREDADV